MGLLPASEAFHDVGVSRLGVGSFTQSVASAAPENTGKKCIAECG